MKRAILVLSAALAVSALSPGARGDLIELEGGKVLHGKILAGQTTEDGLAVQVYDTGGVVVLKWEHVLKSRAKELRIRYGIELEEEEIIYLDAHELTLTTGGPKPRGLVENVHETTGPVRLRTRRGVREYPRESVAAINPSRIEILLVYSPREAYQLYADEIQPDSSAADFDVGMRAFRLGDFEMAKTHYETAFADSDFAEVSEALEGLTGYFGGARG